MNILICDDHRLFGDALSMVLSARSWSVVGVANDPAKALAMVATTHVDTCLMDLNFPQGATGIEGIVSIRETSPDTRVIVLTASSDPQLIMRAVKSGADAIVFKDDELDHIVDVVARTHRSGGAPEPQVASPPAPPARAEHDPSAFLTTREREVLQRLVDGKTGKDLARSMGVAYSTARTHVQNVLMKLGVHSQLEAVAYAIEHNLCEPSRRPAARDESRI
jgi:two-component system nitrate/nitrite response regulator NarL